MHSVLDALLAPLPTPQNNKVDNHGTQQDGYHTWYQRKTEWFFAEISRYIAVTANFSKKPFRFPLVPRTVPILFQGYQVPCSVELQYGTGMPITYGLVKYYSGLRWGTTELHKNTQGHTTPTRTTARGGGQGHSAHQRTGSLHTHHAADAHSIYAKFIFIPPATAWVATG